MPAFLSLIVPLLGVGAPPIKAANLAGSVIRVVGNDVLVGTQDGRVVSFDATSGNYRFTMTGGDGPVRDVTEVDGQVWWVCEGSHVLHTVDSTWQPQSVDLGVSGAVARLSRWSGSVLAHGESQTLAIDAHSRVVSGLDRILPPTIATVCAQGPVLAQWNGDSGLLFSVRRFGRHAKPTETGGDLDVAAVKAWRIEGRTRVTELGGYTVTLGDFRDAEGPEVVAQNGTQTVRQKFGTMDLGNVRVGPEGLVALTKSQALLVPFVRSNWQTQWQPLPVAPDYAQNLSFSGSAAWWSKGNELIQGSLEDGSCDVYVPQKDAKIVGISAVPDGAWITTSEGTYHIRADESSSLASAGLVRYELSEASKKPESVEESLLARYLGDISALNRVAARSKDGKSAVANLLAAAHLGTKKSPVAARLEKARRVYDLRYGDVLKSGTQWGIYLGNGQQVRFGNHRAEAVPIDLANGCSVLRALKSNGELLTAHTIRGNHLLENVFPVGINRPVPSLGHDIFVVDHPGTPFDQPQTEQQLQLQTAIEGWIGTPYVWGGTSKDGCDCSGFVSQAFKEIGISLPRHSQDIGRAPIGTIVTDELRYGDVLVFPNPKHVAIYVGNGRTAEAMSGGVGYSTISRRRLAVVRRFLD
jgi:hypothetical protein